MMYIWYDDRFTQMKRSNAHEVTLRAVLGMLLMYLCPHLLTAVKPAAVQKNTVKPAAIEINVRVYYNDYGNHRNNTEETRF